MIRPLLRRSVALALVAGALASGCSSTLRDAATIRFEDDDGNEHTVHIRRDDFEEDLEAIAESEQLFTVLSPPDAEVEPAREGAIDTDVAATWLEFLIFYAMVDAELSQRGWSVTDEDRSAAEESLSGLDADADFLRRLVVLEARSNALFRRLQGSTEVTEPTEAEAREYFDENFEALTACPSGKQVSHILSETADEAEAIVAELEAGAEFADVAAERSTDPSAATNGGDLGCLGATPFVEEFQTAADTAPLGEVVGPVESEFGFHVILVEEWDPSFEAFRERVLADLRAQQEQAASLDLQAAQQEIFERWSDRFRVHVDPRYGRWGEQVDENGAVSYGVTAPDVPDPRGQRERRADDAAVFEGG